MPSIDFPQRAYVVSLNNGTTFNVNATDQLRLYQSNTLAVFDAAGALREGVGRGDRLVGDHVTRRLGIMAALSVAVLGVSGCDTLKAVTENPACVTRVSGDSSFGGGVPTGKVRFSAVCNAPLKGPPVVVPEPPKEEPTP